MLTLSCWGDGRQADTVRMLKSRSATSGRTAVKPYPRLGSQQSQLPIPLHKLVVESRQPKTTAAMVPVIESLSRLRRTPTRSCENEAY